MTTQELGLTLKVMYENAQKGEKVAMIHLFGIKYAEEIKEAGANAKIIIEESQIGSSYITELSKGMHLAPQVSLRNMSANELGSILRDMYNNAAVNNKVSSIYLFGVKYAQDIKASGLVAREIIDAAQLKESYNTELDKGIKLSKYVKAND